MTLSDKISAGTATYDDFACFGDLHELAWRAYCPPEGSLDAAWRLLGLCVAESTPVSLHGWSGPAENGCVFGIGDEISRYHRHAIAVLLAVIDYRDQQ